jgi:hypothetical protein
MLKSKITLMAGVLFAASLSSHGAIIGTFTGGDVGEGIDFSGNVIYALNVAGNGPNGTSAPDLSIGGLTFKDPQSGAGKLYSNVTVSFDQYIASWANPTYAGGTQNDLNLATMTKSIVYAGNGITGYIDFSGLQGNQQYQLQVLTEENTGANHFPNFKLMAGDHNSTTQLDSSSSANNLWTLQGSTQNVGVVVTLTGWTDSSGTLSLTTAGSPTTALISGVILTQVPEPGAWVSMLGGCGVLMGLRRRRY